MWRAAPPRCGLPGRGTTVVPYDVAQGATALKSKGKTMLKGIDRAISAELLMVLMSMGHGDDLLICDVNHPADTIAKDTTYGRLAATCPVRPRPSCRCCRSTRSFRRPSYA